MKKLYTFLLIIFTGSGLFGLVQNAYAQGGVLPINSSVSGNLTSATPDVYTVTTTADGLLRFTFSTTSPADLYVTLYDNDGTTPLSNTMESFNNSVVVFNVDGLAAGTYKAVITPFSNAYGAYTLSDSLFTSSLSNDIEPNGSSANALNLSLNGNATGHVGYYYNNQRDTTDWYKVTTTQDGLLRVYLNSERSSVYSTNTLDLNVTLYDNDGTTLLGNVEVYNGGNPASNVITTDGLAPGTYYIKVQPYSVGEFADYSISDSLFTPPLANDAEPNGTSSTAAVLSLNGSATGHAGYYYNNQRDTTDWYKVTTTQDGLLRVYVSSERGSVYSTNTLDLNVTLYDNDGTTLLGNVEVYNGGNPASNVITSDGLAPGTYYIKVQPYSVGEFADYTISDSLFTPPLANDAEPNGTSGTAAVLSLNGSATGHAGYYYNNQRDTTDWYKVTTTQDGLLRVYVSSERGSVYSTNTLDLNVTLYDNDGTTQLGSVEVYNGANPASNVITSDGLAAGTYYIKVQPYSTSEFADYTISDSLFTSFTPNDVEPNNTIVNAEIFPVNTNTKGHVGYYYNNSRDTTDWYKLTTITTGPLYLYLSSLKENNYSNTSSNPLDMLLSLYASDGTTQLGSVEVYNGYNPATDSLFFANLAAGTYYVKVTNYSASEFANYSLTNSPTAGGNLPVTFLNFDGKLVDSRAELTWSTATELNNKGFEVEKSADGQSFNSIGFVQGHGNSSIINTYNFSDVKVFSGYNYYRLKQVDIDGNFAYSSAIRLDFKHFDWAVFGNPVTANSWIQVQLAKTSNVSIQIFTVDGKIIQTINKGNLINGTYSIPLSMGKAPAGIYIVRLVVDNDTYSKKIIK